MKYKNSLAYRHELFIATAALAAHASSVQQGFRQRDVSFFFELFSNWSESESFGVIEIQNTQILRYLDALVEQGYLKRIAKQRPPAYRMTRIGLLELLTRITNIKRSSSREYFFFLLFFIVGYRERLEALVRREGSLFPPSLKLELQALLDGRELVQHEIARSKSMLKKLEQRISDATKISELTKIMLNRKDPLELIVREIETRYPYELNSKKPLQNLIKDIAPDQRQWELENGTILRRDLIWLPQKASLLSYLEELKRLTKVL